MKIHQKEDPSLQGNSKISAENAPEGAYMDLAVEHLPGSSGSSYSWGPIGVSSYPKKNKVRVS